MSVPVAYVTVILIWSTTPLAVKWSTQGLGFAFAVAARMSVGLALAAVLVAAWRVGFPFHRRARLSYLAGGLGIFGAMTLTYWGVQYIHSGLVSVLFGLTPLVTGLIAMRWLEGESLTLTKLAGILFGLAGLFVIFGDSQDIGGARAVMGIAALLAAVVIYSASLVWIKHIGDDSPPLATTAGSLAVSLPFFGVIWWLTDGHLPSHVPVRAGMAVAYLGVFGSVLGFALYYYVIKHMEAGNVALITLVTPVFALLLGSALNGEDVSAKVWLGAVLIGLGLSVHWLLVPATASLRRLAARQEGGEG